jgi:hypothetical protein
MTKTTTTPKIITTHDWISVDFGNGRRLTASRSGEKGAGAIPAEVFDKWSNMIRADEGGTIGERIARFVADIDSVWPAWNAPPRAFAIGEVVKYDFGPRRGGIRSGTVVKKLRTTYTIKFGDLGLIRMAGDMLAEFN